MKRSDFLSALVGEIVNENSLLLDKPNANFNDYKVVAERLLKIFEDSGFRPPALSSDHCEAITNVYYGGYTFNMWEEDFDKDEKLVVELNKILSRKK